MLFNSQIFLLLFLPTILLADALCVRLRLSRIPLLVVFSGFFYAWWYPPYIVLLAASILANWTVVRLSGPMLSRLTLALAVGANLVILAYFKYAGLFTETWGFLANTEVIKPEVVLPLAVSFFTFHHIAYLVDLRRGESRQT